MVCPLRPRHGGRRWMIGPARRSIAIDRADGEESVSDGPRWSPSEPNASPATALLVQMDETRLGHNSAFPSARRTHSIHKVGSRIVPTRLAWGAGMADRTLRGSGGFRAALRPARVSGENWELRAAPGGARPIQPEDPADRQMVGAERVEDGGVDHFEPTGNEEVVDLMSGPPGGPRRSDDGAPHLRKEAEQERPPAVEVSAEDGRRPASQ